MCNAFASSQGICRYTLVATGAGDTFDGAFLAQWKKTADAFGAARYANVAAALSTQGYGAVAAIPLRTEVESALSLARD